MLQIEKCPQFWEFGSQWHSYFCVLNNAHLCETYVWRLLYATSNHVGRRGSYSEKEKWLALKNLGHIDLIFHVHVLAAHVHKCEKYDEVSMIKTVARRTVQRRHRMPTIGNWRFHRLWHLCQMFGKLTFYNACTVKLYGSSMEAAITNNQAKINTIKLHSL